MKITNKIMALAIVLAMGLSTASAALVTNNWFKVDFESGYTDNGSIVGAKSDGTWSKTNDDVSVMVDLAGESLTTTGQALVNIGKINTQKDTLVWTPTNAVGKVVLLDADVYMVGSGDAPAISGGIVQTEVFLTNGATSALCVHVGAGGTGSKWVKLEGEAITDKTWIRLRIAIDYDQATPQLSFQVNGKLMDEEGVSTATSFPVMYTPTYASKVTSVSFMGTGYLDNFVGKTVVAGAPTFVNGGTDTDSGTLGIGGSVTTGTGVVNATFDDTNIRYVQLTGPNDYIRSIRTTDGIVSFSTAGLPAGTYSIKAFYGAAPSLTTGMAAPAAATIGANKASEVVGGNISFTVAPKSGLYYTLFAGPNPSTLTAAAASVLASPANEDAGGFIKLAMPVPTAANQVKIIKIYASDEIYAKDDKAPTNP